MKRTFATVALAAVLGCTPTTQIPAQSTDAGASPSSVTALARTGASRVTRLQIDKVEAGAPVSLRQGGPSVVAVEVRADPPGQQILVHFDSDLAPASVTATSILVQDSTGATEPVTSVSYDQDAHAVTLKVKLAPGTYQLEVTTSVQDYKLQPLSQEYTSPIVITPPAG